MSAEAEAEAREVSGVLMGRSGPGLSRELTAAPAAPGGRQASFIGDEVNNIIKDSIDTVLLNASYEHQKVGALRARARSRVARP